MWLKKAAALTFAVLSLSTCSLLAQTPQAGANVNMVSGTTFPEGDPYLQRQNEPSAAVSSRNPQHIMGAANDYRSVDIPFPTDGGSETGDAWLGIYQSIDGGLTWKSTLLPGFPQDQSPSGVSSPLKAYAVATDPTLRAGTHGLFYMSGLVFNRGSNSPSGTFVATYQDQNNKGNGNPISYVGVSFVDSGTSGQFLDKPWIAVDIPRSGSVGSAACNINGQSFTSGNVYVIYSQFLGTMPSNNPHTQIRVATSKDCGKTWAGNQKISESYALNQGTVAAIDPNTGALYIAWRQIANGSQPDQILYAVSTNGGQTFSKAQPVYTFAPGTAFDQNVSSTAFRTIALPALAVDQNSKVYVAFSLRNMGPNGAARIMLSTLQANGSWSTPFIADPSSSSYGHQFFPTLSSAFGKLTLTFYDQRDDNTIGVLSCPSGQTCAGVKDFSETRVPVGDRAAGAFGTVFNSVISDAGLLIRHTLDMRGVQADTTSTNTSPLSGASFAPFRVSQYKYGSRPGSTKIEQMQFNVPNFPLFAQGSKPFIGDYADLTAQYIAADGKGNWTFNKSATEAPVFHAVWTDNRDVRPPAATCTNGVCSQDWTKYTPVASTGGTSLYDPTQQKPMCVPGDAGMRNQNIYTSRITQGMIFGLRENSKSLVNSQGVPVLRQFAVFVKNNTNHDAFYRLTINPPAGGTTAASFKVDGSITTVDVKVLRRSTVARGVFVTSSLARPSFTVSAVQVSALQGNVISGGLQSTSIINPDITNPDITNPDITNPDITNPDITNPDITNPDITPAEIYSPAVTNPDITNPDITNPDITNPDITNPDITNPDITNPDITNPDITTFNVTNPDITNPDITNPDITNPDITNPAFTNPDISAMPAGATDFTWKITNKGNTSSSYNAKLLSSSQVCCPSGCTGSSCPASCYKCQLILRRTYPTPIANQCQLTVEANFVPNSSIPNPVIADPNSVGLPDLSGDGTNGSLSLGPGEAGRMTLRVYGLTTTAPIPGLGAAAVSFAGSPTNTSLTITTQALPPVITGAYYNAQLMAVGGQGALTWSVFSGALPNGLSLNPTTGVISGTPTDTAGTGSFTIQVIDTPTTTPTPHVYRQPYTVNVQQFSVSNVSAFNLTTTTAGGFAKAGDNIEVDVSVSNIGSLTANSVQVFVTVQSTGSAGATCVAQNPDPITLPPSTTPTLFKYICGPLTGTDGTISFSATASGVFSGAGPSTSTTSAAATANIVMDSVAPVISASATTSDNKPYVSGTWTNLPVTVTFACTDALSGVESFTQPVTLSTSGASQSVQGSCVDKAGNTAQTTFAPVNIALGPNGPTISATRSPLPNSSGWNNSPVTISYTCTAGIAPIAVQPVSQTLSAEGVGQTSTGTCTDAAGNTVSTSVSGINIDLTNPGIAATRTPAANAYGWNNTAVSVSFACTDALSGVVAQPATVNLVTQGVNQSATGTCSDKAGNTASTTVTGINIDLTVPTAVITYPANGSNYIYGASGAMQFSCADALSGLASCVGVPALGAALDMTVGTKVVSATATDKAGNSFTSTSSYSVTYKFTGFQTPLTTAGTPTQPTFSGTFNAGKAIPIKWDLFDAAGTILQDTSTLKYLTAQLNANCAGAPPAGSPPPFYLYNPTAGATGGSTFRSSSSGFIFNWDTTSVGTGCYNLVVQPIDGAQYATIVRLK